ncbi:CAP domain-containing protein [Modestobacter versicolor]|uniref:CAP domain-containing protein n=1 Tax=Modestobacter versicolor TaxID=429133 RepID=UPI0034DF8F2E
MSPRPARSPAPGRRSWAPLALSGTVAAVALTAALGGAGLPGSPDPASGQAGAASTSSGPLAAVPAPSVVVPPPVVPPVVVPPPVPSPVTPSSSAPATTPPPAPPAAPEAPVTAPAPAPAPPASPAPAPPPAAPALPPAPGPGPEGQVLALVNVERTAAGCGPLAADAALAAVARAHSADMRDRGFFAHTDPGGVDPFARARAAGIGYARAENIAAGQPDASAVMAAWMASPGHRQNVLDCSLGRLGVGVAEGAGGPWWTQLFGS